MINLYHHSTRSIPRQRCKHHDTMDISYNESGHVAQLTNRRILCTSKSLVPTRCLYIAEPACPFCCCVLLLHGKQAGLALLEFHSILRPPYDTQDEHIVLQWILKCKSKVIRNTRKGVFSVCKSLIRQRPALSPLLFRPCVSPCPPTALPPFAAKTSQPRRPTLFLSHLASFLSFLCPSRRPIIHCCRQLLPVHLLLALLRTHHHAISCSLLRPASVSPSQNKLTTSRLLRQLPPRSLSTQTNRHTSLSTSLAYPPSDSFGLTASINHALVHPCCHRRSPSWSDAQPPITLLEPETNTSCTPGSTIQS